MDNRYYIYELKGKLVECDQDVSGKVKEVSRDILNDRIVINFDGKDNFFDEPDLITMEGNTVTLVYGDIEDFDESDDTLFETMKGGFGDTVDDIINSSSPKLRKTISFEIKE